MAQDVTIEQQARGASLIFFVRRGGRCEAREFIESLPPRDRSRVVALLRRCVELSDGPFGLHDERKFKRLEQHVFELRSQQVRLLLFPDGPGRVVITHGFMKRTDRTPQARNHARVGHAGSVPERDPKVSEMGSFNWLQEEFDRLEGDPQFEFEKALLNVTEQMARRMKELGLRRTDLAERLGVSKAYITKFFDGQQNLTLKTLVRAGLALEAKIDLRVVETRARVIAARPRRGNIVPFPTRTTPTSLEYRYA